MAEGDVCVYRIDGDDRFTSVDDSWRDFAVQNSGGQLAEGVVGTTLWDHISDPETRHLYRLIVERIRDSGTTVRLPFRCDAPDLRRFMRMEVRRLPDGEVEFRSTVVREEPREAVVLLDPEARRSEELVRMCSWCKKVDAGDWVEVEEAVRRLRMFEPALPPRITHGICPRCLEDVQARIPTAGA